MNEHWIPVAAFLGLGTLCMILWWGLALVALRDPPRIVLRLADLAWRTSSWCRWRWSYRRRKWQRLDPRLPDIVSLPPAGAIRSRRKLGMDA
jgi:hypothetical protein